MGIDAPDGRPVDSSAPPPRGPRLGFIILVLIFGGVMLVGGLLWGASYREKQTQAAAAEEKAGSGKRQVWTCSMHPYVVLPKPGNCPVCGMRLVSLDLDKYTGEVAVSPVITQNIGVRIAPVTVGPATYVIRTIGTVDYDETRVADITTKVSGWIEKLHVTYEGERVEKGQPIFDLYSPDLYSAQQEYLLAFKNKDTAIEGLEGKELYEAARKKLQYYDISDVQIADLEKTGLPAKTMTIRSPFEGLVVMKNAFAGMQVQAGAQVYRLADLSRVWIMVTLYEHQLPYLRLGQEATMSLPYIPGQTWKGKIAYIYPYLNTDVRQVKARIEFDNPDLTLKPGMYANVDLHSTFAESKTLVPREAVIDTGLRQIAFVSLGQGRFEPRQVQIGDEVEGGQIVILDGLKQGELVVISGEFLLDSEARRREALAKILGGPLAAAQVAPGAMGGASELQSLPDAASKSVGDILDGYFAIGASLSSDNIEGAGAAGNKMIDAAKVLLKTTIPDHPNFWVSHGEVMDIGGKAAEIAADADIAKAREDFSVLSVAVSKLLHATGIPPAYGKAVEELHCPMFHEGQGGTIWVQPAGDVRNPYFGKAMIGCFDSRTTLPVTGAGAEAAPKSEMPKSATPEAAPSAPVPPAPAAPAQTAPARTSMPMPMTMPMPAAPVPPTPVPAPMALDTARAASPPEAMGKSLSDLLDGYFAVGASLSSDNIEGAGAAGNKMVEATKALLKTPIPDHPDFWATHGEVADIGGKAAEIAADTDIAKAREDFSVLSVAVSKLLHATGVPPAYGKSVEELHCPMFHEGQGGTIWLQATGDARNPYFGKAMLGCFDRRATLPVMGARAEAAPKPEAPKSAAPEAGPSAAPDPLPAAPDPAPTAPVAPLPPMPMPAVPGM